MVRIFASLEQNVVMTVLVQLVDVQCLLSLEVRTVNSTSASPQVYDKFIVL